MAANARRASELALEIKGWDIQSTNVAKKEDSLKLSDGQGNHLTEGVYELSDITVAEFINKENKTFKTLVAMANDQTIWLSQFCKRAIDPETGRLFPQATGPWAEGLQAANSEGKAAKYILEHPKFEIASSVRRDIKDPYTNEVKSKWVYVTK